MNPQRPRVAEQRSTVDQVCEIVAELMGVEPSRVKGDTSLGVLGADELDFVEIIMELEDRFGVTISDETAERMLGTDDWKAGMNNVTMEKLAIEVENQKR